MEVASVSVVIPCYNCGNVLARAVSSILGQTQRPAEIILVEDASPDDGRTRACIQELIAAHADENDLPIKAIYLTKNLGPGGARNAGWDVASGKYIAFLDADDGWHPQKIELQYAWMENHPGCDLSSHASKYLKCAEDEPQVQPAQMQSKHIELDHMLYNNRILTRTVMLRRAVQHRFHEHERFSEDYGLWMRMISDGCTVCELSADLAYSFKPEFVHGGQSGNLWEMEKAELLVLQTLMEEKKIGLLKGLFATGFSVIKYFRRLVIRWFFHVGKN